ncbi:MAG TPA: mandelate racemase/muconate lactonizing enzyme family protein [Pedobacter sp.]|uniref:mandelate racemase/muconate lactonizing enzyme family protein n=1 Tax=Pedobacter sp. TaxID=1411316 RepID=UPI002BB91D2E|nr:mandelate racemase/muconate lactonizing enzyme family protein [Pedobacter sp.]HMI01921.1 mandelate racemase/muconate lactonizing enzyme family protein [Pedobacter sp.]
MKITDVKTILLTGPCTFDPYLSEARKLRSAAFIQIETDSGLVGIGETYAGYFFPEGVPEIVEFFKPVLVGNNVEDIPALWARMYHSGNFWCRVGLGAIVLCGIEAALWDLRGKELDQPVYKLLKERWKNELVHDKLPCYATGGPSNYPPDKLAGKIEYYMSLGFKGVKIGAGAYYKDKGFNIPSEPAEASEFEAAKMEYIRARFGNDLWLMMDAHMGNSISTWGLETAIAVAKAMEPYDLFFLEEPLHYTRPDLYSELCKQTSTPIAGGECLTAACEWQTFIAQDSFHIGQPDASFTAGLDQFMGVAAMLAGRGRKIAPHAWGAGASQMQNIHAGFACANTAILEVAPAYGPLHSEVIGDSLVLQNGYILPPEKPGLGIVLTEATIRKFPFVRGTGEFNSVPGKILST